MDLSKEQREYIARILERDKANTDFIAFGTLEERKESLTASLNRINEEIEEVDIMIERRDNINSMVNSIVDMMDINNG